MQPHTAYRILIVDDEQSIRRALQRSLRKEGYELFFAADGERALELLKQQPVDMVISDHLMPGMNGLQLLKLVRDRHPDVMRLMLTGHADVSVAVNAINEEAIYRFFTKPWDELELKVTLSLAFERLEVERENRRLMAMVRRQYDLLKQLEAHEPAIGHVVRDADGFILLDDVTDARRGALELTLAA